MFLGITINNKLNRNSHIHKVSNKTSKTVGKLNKLRSFLPSGVLQTIYNTLILPHMIYGIDTQKSYIKLKKEQLGPG